MIITQKFIFRSDLQANPSILYLFGDNTKRVGYGGQAKEMRDEPNAVGIATKVAPGRADADYFSDEHFDDNCAVLDADFLPAYVHVALRGTLIVPEDGLGTGLSELPTRAPRTNAYLEAWLERLRDPIPAKAHEAFEHFLLNVEIPEGVTPREHAAYMLARTVMIPRLWADAA